MLHLKRMSRSITGQAKARARSVRDGFTIIEIIVALALTSIITTILFTFFTTSINQYLALQQDGMAYGDLAVQTQRIAGVLRGVTGISTATDSELTAQAYFSPRDAVISEIKYYKSTDGKRLLADVTPYSANPPGGTLQTTQKKTYTVIDNFYTVSGTPTFAYYGTGTTVLTPPIADLHTIKQVRVSLASPTKSPSVTGYNQLSVDVFLRNRKTNL